MQSLHSKMHVRTSKIEKLFGGNTPIPHAEGDIPSPTHPQHGLWPYMGRCATDRPYAKKLSPMLQNVPNPTPLSTLLTAIVTN